MSSENQILDLSIVVPAETELPQGLAPGCPYVIFTQETMIHLLPPDKQNVHGHIVLEHRPKDSPPEVGYLPDNWGLKPLVLDIWSLAKELSPLFGQKSSPTPRMLSETWGKIADLDKRIADLPVGKQILFKNISSSLKKLLGDERFSGF